MLDAPLTPDRRTLGVRDDMAAQAPPQRANAAKARAAIANIGAQMARLRGSFGKAAATARAEAQGNANLSRADVARYTRRTAFNQLRTPVAGTVQQLSIATIGGIVQPAQPLMIIVPDGAAPVVEANVAGKDIGFIREGQAVRVKFEAFPFTTYGIVPGVVESISRDAIEVDRRTGGGPGPQSSLIYAARIRLLQSTIRVRGRDQPIGHGLAVQAEIKTGERRIIDYILSPVARTLDEAGRER